MEPPLPVEVLDVGLEAAEPFEETAPGKPGAKPGDVLMGGLG